jgi:hypothetical protein
MRRYLGCAAVLLVSSVPAASMAEPVRGFVSAELLTAWCESGERLDREACLSYLRGVFDTMQALAPLAGGAGQDAGAIVLRRYAAERLSDSGTQGALFVIRALVNAYPCEAASP